MTKEESILNIEGVSKYKRTKSGSVCFGLEYDAHKNRAFSDFCEALQLEFEIDYYGAAFVGWGHIFLSTGCFVFVAGEEIIVTHSLNTQEWELLEGEG